MTTNFDDKNKQENDIIENNNNNLDIITHNDNTTNTSNTSSTTNTTNNYEIEQNEIKNIRKRNPRQCLAPGCNKCSQGLFSFFLLSLLSISFLSLFFFLLPFLSLFSPPHSFPSSLHFFNLI